VTIRTAGRLAHIEPFYVMELSKAASAIALSAACDPARGGEPMVFLNIGEPDFGAAPAVQAAAQRCLQQGHTAYTHATGLPELRRAIAGWYGSHFGVQVDAERIVVTAGASGALQLACLALFESGDEVLMPDPSYPCNRHFVAAAAAQARLLPTDATSRFQPDAAAVRAHWQPQTRGVLLASPSNPTGTSIARDEMAAIASAVRERGGVTLVDEIYLGLSYDAAYGRSVLDLRDAQGAELGSGIISINSFSKYFGMTGWRLGWLVLPPELVAPVERLAQNLYICASTVAQHAALACFEPASIAEYERRRRVLQERRDFVVAGLQGLDLPVPVVPDGAFYAWFDCSRYSASSWDFCQHMLQHAHVALTPGRDFGPTWASRFVRLSFASSMDQLQTALERLRRELPRLPKQP
jgi:aspartate/methionine/tyrosine aminotransferase